MKHYRTLLNGEVFDVGKQKLFIYIYTYIHIHIKHIYEIYIIIMYNVPTHRHICLYNKNEISIPHICYNK